MAKRPPDAAASPKVPLPRSSAFETTLIAGGFAAFFVLLYTMSDFLNPPLIAAAGLIILWPLRQHRPVRALLVAGAFLMVLWFLDKLSVVLLPFVFIYLLAYLFNPSVTLLQERFRIPRWVSSLAMTIVFLGVIALFVLLLVPTLVTELRSLATQMLASIQDLRTWLTSTTFLDRLEETGLINKQQVTTQITQFIQEQTLQLAGSIPRAMQGVAQSLGSLLGLITVLGILPVLLFYMLKDYPLIHIRVVELFPTWGGRRDYLMQAGGIVGNYLRGQLLISAIAAFNVSVALLILDVPFALLIGLTAGLFNMIPNIGAILTNIIGVLVAIIFGGPAWYWAVVKVVGVLLGQSLLEQSVLTPNILGHQVGLHPILIILSLFIFGYFLGIFGLLIAVPTTAILVTGYKAYRDDLTLEMQDTPPGSEARPEGKKEPRHTSASETSAPVETPTDEE